MNIGLDLRMMGVNHGGIGRYAFEIARNVLEIDAQNQYELFVNPKLTGAEDIGYFKKFANASIVNVSIRHYSILEQTKFLAILNKHNLDLVHFPNFNVPVFYKRPFVVTIHDTIHHRLGGVKKSHWLHFKAYQKVILNAAQKSRRIITVSDQAKNDIVKTLAVSPEKINVIYEGTALQRDVSEERINRVKHKYLLRRPYFLFVGVLQRNKNVVNLARGFDVFMKKYGLDMDLVIAGKTDPHYPEVRHKTLDIKFKERLVLTGFVDDDDLEALYAGAYAFVSASLYEGFGLPGAEAMKFGLPLAVSNIGVFNEIYDNAAVYFNPLDPDDIAEKLHLVARDLNFRSQLQQNALKRSEMFDWSMAGRETLDVYKNCF